MKYLRLCCSCFMWELPPGGKDWGELRNCRSVRTRPRGTVVNSSRIAHDRLSPTKCAAARLCNIQLVSKSGKFAANRFGNELFNADVASLESSFGETARLQSFLDRKSIIRNVGDELGMCLRLIEAAHDAKANAHAILLHKRRDDGVQWPLARCQRVRVVWFQCEERSTIMQNEPCTGCNDSGAEVA